MLLIKAFTISAAHKNDQKAVLYKSKRMLVQKKYMYT